ncbi:hypothetical protein AGMMS49921_11430 [Endomicrobiia bacterium]|nr:hypothetical protein AGMMS49921_11430 [Endomicrobiia bacterium]
MSGSNKVFKQAGRKNGEECISNNSNVCLGGNTKILDSSNATHGGSVAGNSDKPDGTCNDAANFPLAPNNNTLIIKEGASVVRIDAGSFMSMTDNEIIINGGNFNNRDINGAFANNVKLNVVNVNDNRVKINAGNGIRSVYGGFTRNGQLLVIKYL